MALPHAARELVRVVAQSVPGLRDPHPVEQLDGALFRLGFGRGLVSDPEVGYLEQGHSVPPVGPVLPP
jgi:hypothetical protein